MLVMINGREYEIDGDTITFDKLVEVTDRTHLTNTITYRQPQQRKSGKLSPGMKLPLEPGISITIALASVFTPH